MLKLEFMKYTPTARNTGDSLSCCNIYFLRKKNQDYSSTMIVTQSRNVLICLFVPVDVMLSVFTTNGL